MSEIELRAIRAERELKDLKRAVELDRKKLEEILDLVYKSEEALRSAREKLYDTVFWLGYTEPMDE